MEVQKSNKIKDQWVGFLKQILSVLPGGFLIFLVVSFLRWGEQLSWYPTALQAFPYGLLLIGGYLGWRYRSTLLMFGILILALSDRALFYFCPNGPDAGGAGFVVFHLIAFLLPLNLLAISFVKEAGFLTKWSLVRLGVILLQAVMVLLFALAGITDKISIIAARWPGIYLPEGLVIVHAAAAAFFLAGCVLLISILLHPGPVKVAFLWAQATVFFAFNAEPPGERMTAYFYTAVAVLTIGVVEEHFSTATEDKVSGLPARRAMFKAFSKLKSSYAVAVVNIDHFKKLNDEEGYDAGNQILPVLALKIKAMMNEGDAYSMGGGEFAVLFPGKSALEAMHYVENFRKSVEENPFIVRDRKRKKKKKAPGPPSSRFQKRLTITVSAGLAEPDDQNKDSHQVLEAAVKALRSAKKSGRNQVSL